MGYIKTWVRLSAAGALLLPSVVGLTLLMWAFSYPYDARDAVRLQDDWYVMIEGEADYSYEDKLDYYITVPTGKICTMIHQMNEQAHSAAILMHLDYLDTRVWIGDMLLYTNDQDPPGPDKGIRDVLIMMPENYLGRDLTVEISSAYQGFSYSPDPIWFGDVQALAAHKRATATVELALMFPLLLSGLLLMGFAMPAGAGWDGLWFGLTCVLFALWLPGQDASYLGTFEPRMTGRLVMAMFIIYPVPLLWFVQLKCGLTRRFASVLAACYTAAAVGATTAMGLERCAPPIVVQWMSPILLTIAICALLLAAIEWTHKNPFFRMTAPAFLALALGGVLLSIDIHGYIMSRMVLVSGVLLLVLLVWADMFRLYISRRRRYVEQSQLLSIREHLACEQLEAANVQDHETRLLRHEIRHHLSMLSMLQREGKLEQIGQYLDQLDAQERALAPVLYCDHPLVNAIMAKAGRDCAAHSVAFSCEAIVPSGIPIPDTDLAALLMNMLDNAVEAARQVNDAEKWVSVQIQIKGSFLAIRCANACNGDVQRDGDHFVTTKKDARYHGYGILAMKRAAERNGGNLNIDYADGRFIVKVILRLGDL